MLVSARYQRRGVPCALRHLRTGELALGAAVAARLAPVASEWPTGIAHSAHSAWTGRALERRV